MMKSAFDEATIAAIATPPGPGGIGIIRISGSAAREILTRLFVPHQPRHEPVSHKLRYGVIVNPHTGRVVDEVLAVYMKAPLTYTREDVVEIHCHGSYLVLQDVLAQVLALGSARLADPGEFTKRAFLNGRIDLTQAEAVAELLQAKTREGLHLAVNQLQGYLHDKVQGIRDVLVETRAIIEVAIDFPEDDVDILHPEALAERMRLGAQQPLHELLECSGQGRIYREGISVVILGRPNVGKSSLLNSLLREERAIVTAVPGTTRDTIEEYLDIKGVPVRIVDTAGIRETAEAVEEIGIKKARQKLESADLVLLMVDGSDTPSRDDDLLYESVAGKPVILIVNKMDIARQAAVEEYRQRFAATPVVAISAKNHEGIRALEEAVFAQVTGGAAPWEPGHAAAPNLRQERALARTLESVDAVLDGLARGLPPDLLAIELQTALDHLGDIIGETTTEDVLDMIFEQFCIGK